MRSVMKTHWKERWDHDAEPTPIARHFASNSKHVSGRMKQRKDADAQRTPEGENNIPVQMRNEQADACGSNEAPLGVKCSLRLRERIVHSSTKALCGNRAVNVSDESWVGA